MATESVGKRYQIMDRLGAGGMGTVYTALDRLTGQVVAVKQVTIPGEQLEFSTKFSMHDSSDIRLALAQEFHTLASLRHPHIISVLDYGFDKDQQPYFVMEYLGNAQTIIDAGAEQPASVQFELLIQLLQALAYLHRRGIIHRDLKPDNILVVDGQVKVLDFGLAISHQQVTASTAEVSGTLAYLAPELLTGDPASHASDLYSVGIIAWELFTGLYPYTFQSVNQLVTSILYDSPDFTKLAVDERVSRVIQRLLLKNASDRFSEATEIIPIFAEILGRETPPETEAIRESFLQAAQFVGREAEKTSLNGALAEALAGHGGVWLVGGESGVGKSRLLDEVRIQALVKGALVLRGQAVAEGGGIYQVWRDVIRRLVLDADLDDLEAGLLKVIVPDIALLIDRPIPDPPELASQASQDRLLAVIEDLFLKSAESLFVILEDLHWTGSESLALLKRLSSKVQNSPILIIGSYRDDETPKLPDEFTDIHTLKLERLAENDIVQLSESMLGKAGSQQSVVDLLQRETEGNVFFVVEVVRALAEEAGELAKVGKDTLPERVFAGGVQNIVKRRLARVLPEARPLLEVAAVVGRQLNTNILQAIDPGKNLEEWLAVGHNAAVLDVAGGRWRFSHDKLREELLSELSADKSKALHQQVAETLEKLYPDEPEQYAALTYHWGQAKNTARQAHYAALNGRYLLNNGAYKEAIASLEIALRYYQGQPNALDKQVMLEGDLGEALYGLGIFDDAVTHLGRAVELLGFPIPKTNLAMVSNLLRQIGQQLLHRAFPSRFLGKAGEKRDTLLTAARLYDRLSVIWYLAQETKHGIPGVIRGLNLAEVAGPSPEMARTSGTMGSMVGILVGSKPGVSYYNRALEVGHSINDPAALGWVYYTKGYHHAGLCEWPEAEEALLRSLEVNTHIRNYRTLEDTRVALADVYYFQGKFQDALTQAAEARKSATQRGDLNIMVRAMNYEANIQLTLGSIDEPVIIAEQILALNYDLAADRASQINTYGLLALAHLRAGNLDRSWEATVTGSKLIAESQLIAYYAAYGYNNVAEVLFSLLENWVSNRPKEEVLSLAAGTSKALSRFARVFPIVKPQALRFKGLHEWTTGETKKAQESWQKSLTASQKLAMPYEQALAHYELGRWLLQTDPLRKQHLTQAQEIFTRLGAQYYLARVPA